MRNQEIKSSLLLLLTAAIWGFAFVAQRVGSKYLGSFTFNGVRFALGSISLIPLIIYSDKKLTTEVKNDNQWEGAIGSGIITGFVLFFASSLQQVGLVYTTAGKAGFITGFYIVLVPIFGIFLKHRTNLSTWIGVILGIIGLYLLSVTNGFSIAKGDLLEIIGAVFWTIHILLIGKYSKNVDSLKFSLIQFITCSILSMTVALIFEKITINGLNMAMIPILYGGICSVGIAYTLQAIGQKHANPSHAAIILGMESFFAALGGIIILHESLDLRGYLGCALMLSGMILSQTQNFKKSTN